MAGKAQLEMKLNTWGGARKGAGRPKKGFRASEPHKQRPFIKASEPLHVVIRVERDLSGLRKRDIFHAVRDATITTARRENFRIIHVSIQGDHVHLLVEATDRMALARGMQGFQISAAKRINRITVRRGERRTGRVFSDRYYARVLNSPRSVRHALSYVLNNWRHHGYADHHPWYIDPFSSGFTFSGWTELDDSPVLFKPPIPYDGLVTWLPRTSLLKTGWQRHGTISYEEVPGERCVMTP